jgi:hypothetical protein
LPQMPCGNRNQNRKKSGQFSRGSIHTFPHPKKRHKMAHCSLTLFSPFVEDEIIAMLRGRHNI